MSRALWRAILLALLGALAPATASASLPSWRDSRLLDAELRRETPLPPSSEIKAAAPHVHGVFCPHALLKTRVRGFELGLHCSIGGEAGLTCTSRPAYALRYGGHASERSVFTGYLWDRETNLFFAKARFYDPEVGRFTSQDSYLGQMDDPPSLHRYFYANDNPTRYVDPTGHAPGDLWDPRTYFGDGRAGAAWQGFKEGYFENAADVGDSLGGFGKGVGKAAWGLGKGTAGLAMKGFELDAKLKSGNPNKMLDAVSEAYSIGKGAVGHVTESAGLLGHGIKNPGDVLDAMAVIGIEKSGEVVGGATFETAMLVAPAAKGAPVAAIAAEGRRTAVLAAVEESAVARAASRFGEYAGNPAVQAAERGAAQRAAVEAVVQESGSLRGAVQAAGGFDRYAQAESALAASAGGGAVRQTMATGKEWYDYLASQHGPGNVDWVSGSGRTIQWPSQLPTPAATEMLRVRPPARSGAFVRQLESVAGPRPPAAAAHHTQPLFMGGRDTGPGNAAWVPEAVHRAGHAAVNPVVIPLPYGTWIIVK